AAAHQLAWPAAWRVPLVHATADGMKARVPVRGPFVARVRNGPAGRVATIEAFAQLMGVRRGRPVATADQVGWAQVPDAIGFGQRTGLTWDGVGEGPLDVLAVEADLAAGVRPAWFTAHPMQGASLGTFLRQPRRDLAFPGAIDRALAARGKQTFARACARC